MPQRLKGRETLTVARNRTFRYITPIEAFIIITIIIISETGEAIQSAGGRCVNRAGFAGKLSFASRPKLLLSYCGFRLTTTGRQKKKKKQPTPTQNRSRQTTRGGIGEMCPKGRPLTTIRLCWLIFPVHVPLNCGPSLPSMSNGAGQKNASRKSTLMKERSKREEDRKT